MTNREIFMVEHIRLLVSCVKILSPSHVRNRSEKWHTKDKEFTENCILFKVRRSFS